VNRVSIRFDSPTHADWCCAVTHATETIVCDADTGVAQRYVSGQQLQSWDDPFEAFDWMAQDVDDERAKTRGHQRWAGYISYDLGRLVEQIPTAARDDLNLPLFAFAKVPQQQAPNVAMPASPSQSSAIANFSQKQYEAAVQRVIDYIAAGDVYQVNLSQRLAVNTTERAADVYARLLHDAPAEYGAFLDFGAFQIISNSPELFFKVERTPGGRRSIVSRPIKGTRPLGKGMRDQLLHSQKDAAELAMIVDLQRNDLGRVCEIGSVRVTEPRAVEQHPTIYHGVATIEGLLRTDVRPSDILRAVFPCGSVTGCPKIRAMQIIEALEPVRRGAYCGAIGYIGGDGSMQFNVAIRTITLKDAVAYVPVGGGIVADSTPAAEYEETIVKARAMLAALGASLG